MTVGALGYGLSALARSKQHSQSIPSIRSILSILSTENIMAGEIRPIDHLQVFQHRGGLHRTRRALESGRLTIGFTGGSITDPRPGYTWPEPAIAWFVERFPQAHISVENAAIGATGSELAVFRARRELIDRGCDIVFIEFAVNDNGEPAEKRMRTREGLIRKLLAEERDIVLAYVYGQGFYDDMMRGDVPASIAEFEQLGRHYGIGSVWMGLHALREQMAGRMRWEEWLPDGVHPQNRGSLSYAQSVIAFLERELIAQPGTAVIPAGDKLPPPLNPRNWEHARVLPFSEVKLTGPWTLRRWHRVGWYDQVLSTAAVGAKLSFAFTGRGLSLGFDFGRTSSEFRWRLDGGEWQLSKRDRPFWVGPDGWFRVTSIADDLPAGEHSFELEVIHGNAEGCEGTNCNIGMIGVVG